MCLLKTIGLSKEFQRGTQSFFAVRDIDFELSQGEFVHIVGRSGSGKSTFLNLLSGLLRPTAGQILFEGRSLEEFSDVESSRYRNADIGYVPQMMGTLPNLTVLENIMLPFFLFPHEGNAEERAFMLLERLGLSHLKAQFPRALSGGELKRVLLARALMNEPKVLIADEPTSDLDKETTLEVMESLRRVHENGTALIVVTHESDILQYGDRILTMEDGHLTERDDQ